MKGLARVLEEKGLKIENIDLLERYVDLMQETNKEYNISAIRDRSQIYEKHIVDSLNILSFIEEFNIRSLMDIGTGAGVPGIVLAIVCPDVVVQLVESVGKKVSFLKKVKEELALDNVKIYQDRAEELYARQDTFKKPDLVIGRAVMYMPVFLEVVYGLVKTGGYIGFFKSTANLEQEFADAKEFIQMYNMEEVFVKKYIISEDERLVVVFKKGKEAVGYKPRSLKRLYRIYGKE